MSVVSRLHSRLAAWYLDLPRHTDSEGTYWRAMPPTRENTEHLLRESLAHAASHVPYYRELQRSGGFDAQDLSSWPILTRRVIRDNFDALKAVPPPLHVYRIATSGSTGQPLNVLTDDQHRLWSRVAERYFWRECMGIDPLSESKLMLWGAGNDITKQTSSRWKRFGHWLSRTTFVNPVILTPDKLDECVEVMNRVKPIGVKGYVTAIYRIAKHAEKKGVRMHCPRGIFTTSDILLPNMREIIERVFRCKISDFYGAREIGSIAGQCQHGNYHPFMFHAYVELLDSNNQPVAPGERGRIVVTTLHNRIMPLIRYEIDDLAVAGERCPCGTWMPTWCAMYGRLLHSFTTDRGAFIDSGVFLQYFWNMPWIDEFCIVQRAINDIEVLYVPRGAVPDQDRFWIEEKLRFYMGPECRIAWTSVKEIPQTGEGKFLYARNMLETELFAPKL